jgi:VanZ family protein
MTTPRKILVGLIVLVCYLCLFPWEAKQGAGGPWFLWHWPQGRSGVADVFLNILLFVPIGICAPFGFRGRWRFVFAILLGCGLSFFVEYLQGWLPSRVSSVSDLMSNTLGTMLGVGLTAWISHWGHHEISLLRGIRIRYPILMLMAFFVAGQCFPFVPNYRLPHLRRALEALTDFSGEPFLVLLNLTIYSAIGLLLRTVVTPEPPAWIRWLAPVSFLAMRPLFASAPMGGLELAGALAGVGVGTLAGGDWLRRCLFVLYPAVLTMDQVRPFTFLSEAQPFGWLPFLPLYSLPPMVVVRYLAEKLFFYGTAIAILAQWPLTLPIAAAMVTIVLGLTEGLQVYLPGRTPESTDPVLALAAWAILAAGLRAAPQRSTSALTASSRILGAREPIARAERVQTRASGRPWPPW